MPQIGPGAGTFLTAISGDAGGLGGASRREARRLRRAISMKAIGRATDRRPSGERLDERPVERYRVTVEQPRARRREDPVAVADPPLERAPDRDALAVERDGQLATRVRAPAGPDRRSGWHGERIVVLEGDMQSISVRPEAGLFLARHMRTGA